MQTALPDWESAVIRWSRTSATWLERLLALAIILAVLIFAVASVAALSAQDWRQTETFYDTMYRVLLVVIGLELARTLVTHNLEGILELLAFVVARKTLKPDVNALEIGICTLAFIGLLAARKYLLRGLTRVKRKTAH